MIFQQIINGLMLGATYSLVAIGYTLIFGVLGILHFAHGEVLMVGAFMGLYIIVWSGLPLYIALPLAMLATGVLGVLIDLLAIRPLRKDFHLGTAFKYHRRYHHFAEPGRKIFRRIRDPVPRCNRSHQLPDGIVFHQLR